MKVSDADNNANTMSMEKANTKTMISDIIQTDLQIITRRNIDLEAFEKCAGYQKFGVYIIYENQYVSERLNLYLNVQVNVNPTSLQEFRCG